MNDNSARSLKDIMATYEKHVKEEQERWNAMSEEEKQRILDDQRRKEEAENRDQLLASYRGMGIPPRFFDVSWDNWISDTEDKAKAFHDVKDGAWKTNLFMCGKSGTGKTHLAMCLAKDGATYRRLPDIFREVRTDFNSEQDVIDRYGNVKLLIIDEVGRQKFSNFEKNLFFEIIDKRWNNVLPTTMITNLNKKEFFSEYGTAILDRIRPLIVEFTWESRRESLNLPSKKENQDDIDF